MKDDFLAVLSHELRTPLNAVMGYTQLLTSGALQGDDVTHAYQAIQRNAQAQARLVESLLDLSRVLAGKLELNSEVLDLSSVVALAVEALRPEALKRHISLELFDASGIRVFGGRGTAAAGLLESPVECDQVHACGRSREGSDDGGRRRMSVSASRTTAAALPPPCCRSSSTVSSKAKARARVPEAALVSAWRWSAKWFTRTKGR